MDESEPLSGVELDREAALAIEALDALPAIVWEFDPVEDRFTYVNRYAQTLLGWPWPAWRMPGFWESHIHPEDRARAIAACRSASKAAIDHEIEYRLMAEDGRFVCVHDSVRTVHVAGKRRLRGVMVDVTERHAEEELHRAQEQQLRALVDAFHGFILRFDTDGRVSAAYGNGLRAARLPGDGLIGKRLRDFLRDDAEVDEAQLERALRGEVVEYERSSRLHPLGTPARLYRIRIWPDRKSVV